MALLDHPWFDNLFEKAGNAIEWVKSKLEKHKSVLQPIYETLRPIATKWIGLKLPSWQNSDVTKTTESVSPKLLAAMTLPERYG